MSTPAAQSGTVGGSNQATGTFAVPDSLVVVTSRDSRRLPDASSRRTGSLDKRPCKKTTFMMTTSDAPDCGALNQIASGEVVGRTVPRGCYTAVYLRSVSATERSQAIADVGEIRVHLGDHAEEPAGFDDVAGPIVQV